MVIIIIKGRGPNSVLQHRALQGIQVKVTNFEGSKSDYTVQLIVTTEKVVPDKKRMR